MRIVVNHLTRMGRYVCIAGVNNGSHLRPVLKGKQIPRTLLKSKGGPVSLGAVIDLGSVISCSDPPKVEDIEFDLEQIKLLQDLRSDEFFQEAIKCVTKSSLKDIFGEELIPRYTASAVIPEGIGTASLGILGPLDDVRLFEEIDDYSGRPKIRFSFNDQHIGNLDLSVTDLRLWNIDQRTPYTDIMNIMNDHLDGCYIAVGLTGIYGRKRRYHWLQVNNIFPKDDPLWARE